MPSSSPSSAGPALAILLALAIVTLGLLMLGQHALQADHHFDERLTTFETGREALAARLRDLELGPIDRTTATALRGAWRDVASSADELARSFAVRTVPPLMAEVDGLIAHQLGVRDPGSGGRGSNDAAITALGSIGVELRQAHAALRRDLLTRHRNLAFVAFALLVLEAALLVVPSMRRGPLAETTAQRAGANFAHLAHHDDLTGLANRRGLEEHLRQLMSEATAKTRFGLILCDLDAFKPINDLYGHAAGDAVLKAVARRLQHDLRPGDVAARLGGDEFVLVVADAGVNDTLTAIAERLKQRLANPLRHGTHELHFEASLGTAVFPKDGSQPHALLSAADAAMYEAKQVGGMAVRAYNKRLRDRDVMRQEIARELETAVAGGGLELVFQPQLELATGRVVGLEALARWPSAGLGDVPPETFIPLAENTGLLAPFTRWLFAEVERYLVDWAAMPIPAVRVSINVSGNGLVREDIFAELLALSERTRSRGGHIGIEISEDAMFGRSAEAVLTNLRQLHEQGVAIAIDDFGTGYASLSLLDRIPFDRLKIAGGFVRRLEDDANAAAVVQTIIELAQRMGGSAVATSVESARQLDFLQRHACDEAQGYLLARPMQPGQAATYLGSLAQAQRPVTLPPRSHAST